MKWLSNVTAAWCIFLGFAVSAWSADSDYILPVAANEIKIMNYNVENLFDAEHDAGKNDYEFLPANHPAKKECEKMTATRRNYCLNTDWTEAKIQLKFGQIKKVVDAQGVLPDILTLQEVENPKIIRRLTQFLGFDGFYMTNSPDARGIDTAILYRKQKLTPIDFKERELKNPINPTRNLSVAHFKLSKALGGGVLGVYPNHWPSQGTRTTKARLIPAEQLGQFIGENARKYKGQSYYVVATGDFNTLEHEKPNPVHDVLLSAKNGLLDVAKLSRDAGNPMHKKMPPATYYYAVDKTWNEFDHIVISKNLLDRRGLEVDPHSFRVHAPSFLCKKNDEGEDIPFRYNHNTTNPSWLGYADHFAVVVKLRFIAAFAGGYDADEAVEEFESDLVY